MPTRGGGIFYDNNITGSNLFQTDLEDSIGRYQSKGSVVVVNDLNYRTGAKEDSVISNDELENKLVNFIDYSTDASLVARKDIDHIVNSFGKNPMSLC